MGLAREYERSLAPDERRARGVHFTPDDVCDRLVERVLGRDIGTARVCDPACGGGNFLLAAGRALEREGLDRRAIARDLLWGFDIDQRSVALTRRVITEWSSVDPGDHIRRADALDLESWDGAFDLVVGNPPFQNQLERATIRTTPLPARWRPFSAPYADTAWLFLLVAVALGKPGGRVVIVQPQSIASARDAAAIRAELTRRARIDGMWTADSGVFDAQVRVCAPMLTVGTTADTPVRRWRGRAFDVHTEARLAGDTWGPLLARADEPPTVALQTDGTLADLATATAGFRDQFYGLAPTIVDASTVEDERMWPRLVTTGLIDVAHCAWGERRTRFAGQYWDAPRVDITRIETDALREWVTARLVPKVVVATQTKVIEAVVDRDGTWVPSTPVIAVAPKTPDALWPIAAVLVAPPVSALAAHTYAGAALQSGAIKLSAKQVLDLPAPAAADQWEQAAQALRRGDVEAAAILMNTAYGAPESVLSWWRAKSNRHH